MYRRMNSRLFSSSICFQLGVTRGAICSFANFSESLYWDVVKESGRDQSAWADFWAVC